MKTILQLFCLLSASVLMSNIASAEMLLSDNFNDNSLNTSLWELTPSNKYTDHSSGEEINGRIELVNRATLNTADQYDPYDYLSTGGITITGKVCFANLNDISTNTAYADSYQTVIRSNDVYNTWGEVTSGISFTTGYIFNGSVISLDAVAKDSSFSLANTLSIGTISIYSDTWYDFTITDDGTNLSYTLTQSDNSANTASVTAQVTSDTSSTDYIFFYGREYNGNAVYGDRTEYLDDISISTGQVPEPSSIALLTCGLIGLLAYAWRKRK